jgi:hypothetical protein
MQKDSGSDSCCGCYGTISRPKNTDDIIDVIRDEARITN